MTEIEKFAVEGGTCTILRFGTVVLRAWPADDGLPGEVRLSRTDLAELFRRACGDPATMHQTLAQIFHFGHRLSGYDPDPFPGPHPDDEYPPIEYDDYTEEPF